jgi:hypothetical protein
MSDSTVVYVVEYGDACGGSMDQLVWHVFADEQSAQQYIDDGYYADPDYPYWGDDGISHPRLFAVSDWPTPVISSGEITSFVVDAFICVTPNDGQHRVISVDPDISSDDLRALWDANDRVFAAHNPR